MCPVDVYAYQGKRTITGSELALNVGQELTGIFR